MPQALATVLVPWISNALIAIGLPSLAFGASVGAIALGASYLLLAGAAFLAYQAFSPEAPRPPRPEDGKYNLKQPVPPLTYVLGRVKKGGDYAFLEETEGIAYHIIVQAAHHVRAFVHFYLHDEEVDVNSNGYVTSPEHFGDRVSLYTRRGEAASDAYPNVISAFPEIWTEDHRGDGLATICMEVRSAPPEDLQSTFPSGMPVPTAIMEGHDQLFDPRTYQYGYSTNIAIFRFWHLTHPVGGKLSIDDMYLPDWQVAANVCDEGVLDRNGDLLYRYQGGYWFRSSDNPVEIGRVFDQAAEMVLYETPDGKVGVHAGEYVAPDIRLAGNSIRAIRYTANRRPSTTVVAVRGRYTEPDQGYTTTDAAIYGVPYPTDDERTKTVQNPCVQKHNHMARLQKLAHIRANAPRVVVEADYEAAEEVPYRRFVRIHYPPMLVETVVEVIGRPTLSLVNMTMTFEGIVVPEDLYAFNAATEEGVPGANVLPVERQELPVPTGFNVAIQSESVAGGTAYFGLATWTVVNPNWGYELEWEPTAGGTVQTVQSNSGDSQVRSLYLSDNVEYRFRLRTWALGGHSNWTGYITRTP